MKVLITGASSGLGAALATRFAELGAELSLSARRVDRLHTLRDQLVKKYSSNILITPCDVSSKEATQALVEQSVTHFGGIDVFIANAGQGMWSRFRDLSDPDQLSALMQVNYMGVVYGLFYSLPHLRKTGGSFVAISSIQGLMPVIYHTGYVASKYAVNGLIETIRLEEPDIHFLLALPSWIAQTELRSHALTGKGSAAVHVKKSHGKSAVSAEDCAKQIILALKAKKKNVFIPHKYQYLPIIRDLFTTTFDRVVNSKVKEQLEEDPDSRVKPR